ncbi:MAG: XamI family restriction endonuclease [Halieaceae bacterium]
MAVNCDKTNLWKQDVALSVDFYNEWFLKFAPAAFRQTRIETTGQVASALEITSNLTDITPLVLKQHPSVLQILRMTTCPPIARDRLVGLAGVKKSLVNTMEKKHSMPPRMKAQELDSQLASIGSVIEDMSDVDIFPWKQEGTVPSDCDLQRASTIIADRLCGALADPIIRNAQETRQLEAIRRWLSAREYRELAQGECKVIEEMPPGTFSFRMNVPGTQEDGSNVNIPVDAVIMRKDAAPGTLPALFEAKSAGDFTNTNKRRKEEAQKILMLRRTFGDVISFDLFLCGYFNAGYLGFEAAEGIDWVWEHRIDDLEQFGF